ncbi:MSHA biogenesis protein MshQ [Pseudomonas stutzeri]|uniref:DUF6701 domain-containing protein n=1 Tax=Stutzerimonas stutzeri TaxID=316 RepID=UPI0011AF8E16|nr:DUF6701 domain-containing protein [Stutzerimonas stutzeri]MCQ4297062.1 MSHA biogenesis protein MshQ [Stutzerimonas stutzeri]
MSTVFWEGLGDIRVVANGGFALSSGVTIGTSAKNISLESTFGTIDGSGNNTIRGSITTGSGAVNLVGSNNQVFGSVTGNSGSLSINGGTISGSVSSNASVSLTNGSVSGSVYGGNGVTINGMSVSGDVTGGGAFDLRTSNVGGLVQTTGLITTNGTVVSGTLTSTNGSISLTGGSISGLVRSGCCTVTTNGTNLLGGARSDSSGLQITGGTIQGNFHAANNAAQFSGVNMVSGSVTGAGSATFTSSTLGSAELPISVTTVSGAVTLNSTTAFGDFTAPSYSTIFVNSPSTVIGTCLPNSTPANACRPPAVPSCLNDSFNRAALGNDWAVTSRNGSFGVPRIIGNRLRLTDNSGNVATGATVQRLVPAAGNLVQIEFKYYAYNGSGADGVAVIFSDASVTPQPGGYGGSLGYAQLNGVSGFSGGWLGIALDEFGNFSNPTETRVGGPGARADSVSIRGSGSGTSGYRYLRGAAANLNPGVDVSGTTPGPGHTYRITLDSRIAGRTLVSVERNTGAGFATLIAPFDAQAEAGQAALPQNFFVTFTGSTGGSNNVHELDDLSFCADRLEAIGQQIDHFRFEYSGDAVTCNPQPVTIRACLDSACSSLFTDPVTVTLTPNNGWTATAPASVSGGNVLSFSGGVASAQLRNGAVGAVTLGITGSVPATKPLSVPVCSTSNCRITYADSGFIFDAPTLISARTQSNIPLRAVRSSNNAQLCVPGFANVTRTLQFSSIYVDPASGTQPVVVNGTNVSTSPTGVALAFDTTGSASLAVRYDDAGQMRLTAIYNGSAATGDNGLSMTGTDPFLVKPYGLCLETDSLCTAAGVSGTCPVFAARAGDNFPLRIRAVGWQTDGELLNAEALCVGNPTTPNFRLAGIGLSSQLVAPVPGSAGTLLPQTYEHVLGTQTSVSSRLSEVGVFRLVATPPAYFGESIGGGSSALVGRIIPASLGVQGSAALQPACGAFSYQEQAVDFVQPPTLVATGLNRQGAVTNNYDREPFWRLNPPALSLLPTSETGRPGLDGRITAQGSVSVAQLDAVSGDGEMSFVWSGRQLIYRSALQPSSEDAPIAILARQSFSAAELTDKDGACFGGTTCQPYSFTFGGSELRLGRLSLDNAHGSELKGLSLPLRIESWRDGAFQTETQDTCSAPLLGNPALVVDTFTGNLSAGETTPSRSGPTAGIGQILMSAPGAGNDGSVQVELPGSPAWLLYDWNGTGRQTARGLASFGIYQGSPPLIFRRELYR